jgi:hypothetical protein
MLLAVALLLQFPLFSASQVQTTTSVSEPAVASRSADELNASKTASGTPSATEVLIADKLPIDAEASVAYAPGRLVPEPVAPAGSGPAVAAAPIAEPASPAPIKAAPILYGPPIRVTSDRWQRREWLALSIAAHGAAGFDAWSTRRVISSVPGAQEMNPLLRPFAGNGSMYAAVQVAPTILDFVSRKMMTSRHDFLRHTWWLPQAVSAVISISSGVHNVGIYNSR